MTFGAKIKGSSTRPRNHKNAEKAKVELRRNILAEIDECRVLDAFAGAGVMYSRVWRDAADYTGIDENFWHDCRKCFVGDNRRVMRNIDLSVFNVFDFDAYGSPWEQCLIMAANKKLKPDERVGIAWTDGSSFKLRMGSLPLAIREICKIKPNFTGANRWQHDLINKCLQELAQRMNAKIERSWQAENPAGAKVKYGALILRGLKK